MSMHHLRMELEIPDGPGALYRLIFVSVTRTHSAVNLGKVDVGAVGGWSLMNW
jgi:hypothetical protein